MPTRLAHEVFDGFTHKPITYTPPDPAYIACNPSVHRDHDGVWRCIMRCINYRLGGHVPEEPNTANVMCEIDPDQDWAIVRAKPMADRTGTPKSGYPISGFEDCRLFQWQGRLWASATTCHLTGGPVIHGNREMVLLELDQAEYNFIACHPLRGPWSAFYQKNWIPLPGAAGVRFVYSVDNALVIGVNHAGEVGAFCHDKGLFKHKNDVAWRAVGDHRGSSQGVRLADGHWLFLVHTEGYQSRFVLADDETCRPSHKTECFHFRELGVEFAAGMALDSRQLVVSYSVRDATTELGFFPLESVMAKMERIT